MVENKRGLKEKGWESSIDEIMTTVTVMDDEGMQRSRNSSFVNNLGEFLW